MNTEGAAGISTSEDRSDAEVVRKDGSSRIAQGALLRYLCGQVGADPCRVCVDENANPNDSASLEMKPM